ncbi:MAG: ferritin family protein [Candidatus Margulisiibacteriota bacterium]
MKENNIGFIHEDLAKAAKTAITMEKEGYDIYVKAANMTKNVLGKSTLMAIAEKEVLHRQSIESFYSKLTGASAETISVDENNLWSAKLRTEILSKIKDALDKLSGSDKDLVKTYEIAMDLELKGYNFYNSIAAQTDNEDAKRLFAFLAKEENIHFDILQETHLYLSNPSEWFHKEEKWLVEG